MGSCENLVERLRRHNLGHSKATRHGMPWTLVHSESFSSRAEAAERERDITNLAVVAMNSSAWVCSAVAAATGRGFKSRRPEKICATDYHR
jgi:GIY-YIG catalytic domain